MFVRRRSDLGARLARLPARMRAHPAVRRGLRRAGDIYIAYLVRRYRRNMMGGGDWRRLAASTIRRRRAKGIRHSKILFVTGAMLGAVKAGAGLSVSVAGFVLRVVFDLRTKLGRRMSWHHSGAGNYPARPILVAPDRQTEAAMRRAAAESAKQAALESMKR